MFLPEIGWTKGGHFENAATKATMLDLADQYDRLAKRVGGSGATLLLTSGEVPRFGP